jgi:hypothetical protein
MARQNHYNKFIVHHINIIMYFFNEIFLLTFKFCLALKINFALTRGAARPMHQ